MIRSISVRFAVIVVAILGVVFVAGAFSSLFEPNGGGSWVHQVLYKGKMILGLQKLAGVEGGLSMSSARYEFETMYKTARPGVWHLTSTDTRNILALERNSGLLLLLTPENGSYTERVIAESVFPLDADGKPIINKYKSLVNSNPPIAMGSHYAFGKLYYSLVTQTETDGTVCQKMSLMEVPLQKIDAPGKLTERFVSPCSPDKDNAVMWAGRITHNETTLFLSVGEQRYDRSGYPKSAMFNASDLVVRNTVFGKILAFNPKNFSYTVYSSGHRNAQGLFWDPSSRTLVSAEHGPNGGDEVNVIVKGNDYGWPFASFGKPYPTLFPTTEKEPFESRNPSVGVDQKPARRGYKSGSHEGFAYPLMAWSPGTGIGNLFKVPTTSPLKDWRGDIVVAMMGENTLHRLKTHKGVTVFDENIALKARVRDLMLTSDGDLVLSLDKGGLVVLRVSKL